MSIQETYEKRAPLTDPLVRHSPEGHYFVALCESANRQQTEDLRRLIQLEGGHVGGSLGKHHQPHGFHAVFTPQTLIQVKNHEAVQYVDTKHPGVAKERMEELRAHREQQKSVPEDMEFILK